jgi:cell division protein FtsQ
VVLALLALAAGGWVWLRNSSLVAVQRVTVIGVSGRDADQIRAALTSAAHNMTTLDVKMSALRTAVAPPRGYGFPYQPTGRCCAAPRSRGPCRRSRCR